MLINIFTIAYFLEDKGKLNSCFSWRKIVDIVSLQNSQHNKPLNANSIKWSNALKQFAGNLPANCLSVFDYFVRLALKMIIVSLPNIPSSQGK